MQEFQQTHLEPLLYMQPSRELGTQATTYKPERKNPDLPGRKMKQAIKIKICNPTSNPKGNFQTPRYKTRK